MTRILTVFLLLFSVSTAQSAVIFQDNFDGYTDSLTNHGWYYAGSQVSTAAGEGTSSSRAAKITYIGEETGPYVLSYDLSSLNLQEIYIKFSFKVDDPSGGAKFLKFFGKQDSPQGYANTTFGLNYFGNNFYEVSYGAGDIENDTSNSIRYEAEQNSYAFDPLVNLPVTTSSFDPADGQWHTFEVYMRYNSNGQRDGAYTVWIDGNMRLQATNVKNRNDANSLYFSYVSLGDYCSGQWAHTWHLWYDDVIISTSRAGTVADTTPPSVPTGITATAVSSSQVNLSWTASTDNIGVIEYKVYRGGTYLRTVTGTSTTDTGLTASTTYNYKVSAVDSSGNESAQSTQVSATTFAPLENSHTLTITKSGTCTGWVSDPNYVDCGTVCAPAVPDNIYMYVTWYPEEGCHVSACTGGTLSGSRCSFYTGTVDQTVNIEFTLDSDVSSGSGGLVNSSNSGAPVYVH